jgi:GH25 family lysozyme M1 (1,4-beta-N-acetylmuramidase)
MLQPRVVDISHHNRVVDLHLTAAAGAWGVIHKSSQGRGMRDPDYAARRIQARAAGLLWGAYHFNDGSDVEAQVAWFIKCAAPDDETLMVLDFEDNKASNMTVQNAVKFLRLLEQRTGRKGAIYSGNRLKETIAELNAADRAYLCAHRLWLCQYGPRAVLPHGFAHYWLWQYTGDGVGQKPHTIAGIIAGNGGLDLNLYDGDREQLAREWAAPHSILASIVQGASSHSRAAELDQAAANHQVDPPAPIAAPPADPIAPPPAPAGDQVAGDPEIYSVQRRLKAMNYSPGILSGAWGGMTSGAIAAFLNDRDLAGSIVPPTSLDQFEAELAAIKRELSRAEAEGFKRKVTAERASGDLTTVAKVAPEVLPARRSYLTVLWGSITTFFAAFVDSVSDKIARAWSFFFEHKDDIPTDSGTLQAAWDYLGRVPTPVWLVLAGAVLLLFALDARGGVKSIIKSVQTGARQ